MLPGDVNLAPPAPPLHLPQESMATTASMASTALDTMVSIQVPDFSMFTFGSDEPPPMVLTHQPPTSTLLVPPMSKDLDHYVAEVIQKRLQFSVDVIKKAPITMVLETQTPWCHPLVFTEGMPQSMLGEQTYSNPPTSVNRITSDAHSCCALYMAKTSLNAPVIFRSIESRVNDLLEAPTPLTPKESLAHTQSLILYQAIRLFDGDIRARASAERTIPALETSALCLLSHIQYDPELPGAELPLYPLASTKAFWNDWVFQESARRTFLLTFYFLQAYRILSGVRSLECDGKLGLVHSFTLSSHLWGARSPVEFAEAWRNRKRFIVTNAGFDQVLDEAQPEDVDIFGRMMLSSVIGFDEAEGWFAARGGVLDEGARDIAAAC